MSRAFVKEDDQEEVPIVPPRAHLPEGFVNYVTPLGLKLLNEEKQDIIARKSTVPIDNDKERRLTLTILDGRLQLLNNRIATAKVVRPEKQLSKDSVRFGAHVTLKNNETNQVENFQIVGVDEADISQGKIAFTSPMARILLNKHIGDTATLILTKGSIVYELIDISYPDYTVKNV
ncbi:GreA/GreB family elongation factor [Aquimarina sp. W85]|uniref:GreA/GreB family elongation factor n=1 Tax=Aquimarina rhodophyticola TaxID=3342246 RepID=UPI00366C97E7